MNKFNIIFVLGLLVYSTASSQWAYDNCPVNEDLNAIAYSNENLWIVGDNGIILNKSKDAWEKVESPTSKNLYSIFIVSDNDIWAVGDKGTIIHYNGVKWDNVKSELKMPLYAVSFSNPDNGIAVGVLGTILHYKNGIWEVIEDKQRGNLYAVTNSNSNYWIGGGMEGIKVPIMQISENGSTSLVSSYSDIYEITGFSQPSFNGIWAVGTAKSILHYDGKDWNKLLLSENTPSMIAVAFNNNKGISVGYSGAVLLFNGYDWDYEKTNTKNTLRSAIITENSYVAVGDGGTIILKRFAEENSLSILSKSLNIYPNPCTDYLNLQIEDNDLKYPIHISIFDLLGRLLFNEIINDNLETTYSVPIFFFENGTYLLRLTSENKIIKSNFSVAR